MLLGWDVTKEPEARSTGHPVACIASLKGFSSCAPLSGRLPNLEIFEHKWDYPIHFSLWLPLWPLGGPMVALLPRGSRAGMTGRWHTSGAM